MKKKVLITGVNGFIGRALWQYLNKGRKDLNLFGLDLLPGIKHSRIHTINLNNASQLKDVLRYVNPDYIFHLAGGRMRDKHQLETTNVGTTKVLFETLRAISMIPRRIIIPGSAAEYGKPASRIRRINEKYTPKPLGDYGKVKLKQTRLALGYVKKEFDVVVARIFNILGENTPDQLVAGRFTKQIVRLESESEAGTITTMNLNVKRDFLDIQDICQALWQIAMQGHRGHVYNICSSTGLSIEHVLYQLIMFSHLTDVDIVEKADVAHKTFDVVGSNAKLRAHTSWSQEISIQESLKRTLSSYRKITRQ